MEIVLETKNLCKHYGTGENLVRAVDNTSIQILRGEFVVIIGKSGSGKSTLLHLLGGLDAPTSGSVFIAGEDISSLSEEKLSAFRRQKIGFIFQSFNLIPSLTVWENIVLPLGLDKQEPDHTYLDGIIQSLGLEAKLENRPATLSGGQQQRVAIARAMAAKPAIILADEPTGNLDSKTSGQVLRMLRHTAQAYGQTLVVITHDDDIAKAGDRAIVIEDGRVVNAHG